MRSQYPVLVEACRISLTPAGRSHRHHRYVFEEMKGKQAAKEPVGARLQEIGPRFTLRLRSLQVRAASKPCDC